MKILQLEIINNKKIKCFFSSPNGKNLSISGDTGTGKTTAISALWEILEKKKDALTHGKKTGFIKVELGDSGRTIIAERNITKKTSTITITDEKNKKVSIADFKKMISGLAINPHKILDMKPTEQTNTLLRAVKLDVDLDDISARIDVLKEKRLIAFRDTELTEPGVEPEKIEAVVFSDLVTKRDKNLEVNKENQEKRDLLVALKEDRDKLRNGKADIEQKMEELGAQLSEAQEALDQISDKGKKLNKEVAGLCDIDCFKIDQEIAAADEVNAKAAIHAEWFKKVREHEEKVEAHAEFNVAINELREVRASALEKAIWPIDGLSIQDGTVAYKDTILKNLGTSEQMLVCAALAIEDIKGHDIRVVRMDGIESMSKQDFEALKTIFNKEGIQVLSTRVSRGDTDKGEIVIVDGQFDDKRKKGRR